MTNQQAEMPAGVAHVHHGLGNFVIEGLPRGEARMIVVAMESAKGGSNHEVENRGHGDDARTID